MLPALPSHQLQVLKMWSVGAYVEGLLVPEVGRAPHEAAARHPLQRVASRLPQQSGDRDPGRRQTRTVQHQMAARPCHHCEVDHQLIHHRRLHPCHTQRQFQKVVPQGKARRLLLLRLRAPHAGGVLLSLRSRWVEVAAAAGAASGAAVGMAAGAAAGVAVAGMAAEAAAGVVVAGMAAEAVAEASMGQALGAATGVAAEEGRAPAARPATMRQTSRLEGTLSMRRLAPRGVVLGDASPQRPLPQWRRRRCRRRGRRQLSGAPRPSAVPRQLLRILKEGWSGAKIPGCMGGAAWRRLRQRRPRRRHRLRAVAPARMRRPVCLRMSDMPCNRRRVCLPTSRMPRCRGRVPTTRLPPRIRRPWRRTVQCWTVKATAAAGHRCRLPAGTIPWDTVRLALPAPWVLASDAVLLAEAV